MPIQPLSAFLTNAGLRFGSAACLSISPNSIFLKLSLSLKTTGPTYAAGAIELCTTACFMSRMSWKYASGVIGAPLALVMSNATSMR